MRVSGEDEKEIIWGLRPDREDVLGHLSVAVLRACGQIEQENIDTRAGPFQTTNRVKKFDHRAAAFAILKWSPPELAFEQGLVVARSSRRGEKRIDPQLFVARDLEAKLHARLAEGRLAGEITNEARDLRRPMKLA